MHRPPIVTSREMVRVLKKAGFIEKRQTGSHLILFNPESKKVTTVPIHAKTLGKGLTHTIIEQSGLNLDEFIELL